MKNIKILSILTLLTFFPVIPELYSRDWYPGIFRVNSDISAGTESIETISEKSRKAGLKFLVFSDQFIVCGEYGLPPFRNVLKYTRNRRSIVSYGVENYIKRINENQTLYPDMVLIPGADIAPHYYWTGNLFKKNLAMNQYSEQLTVFGPMNPDFFHRIPVIHHARYGFSFPETLLDLTPLLLALIGILLFFSSNKPYYADRQGNTYQKSRLTTRITGTLIFILGILWTFDNKPFIIGSGFSQYRDYEHRPFQHVIDYIRKTEKDAGVFWSAPEITMNMNLYNISLLTAPYLDDVENTSGFNGLAGIYGDTSTAHNPGELWDMLLMDYCKGIREHKPVIVGELDYHGTQRTIDLIQTVIHTNNFDRIGVHKAIKEGNSYAVLKVRGKTITLDDVLLSSENNSVSLGETLIVVKDHPLTLNIKGHVAGANRKEKIKGNLVVIVNGKETVNKIVDLNHLDFTEKIHLNKNGPENQYVRFEVKRGNAGWLLANPIFIKNLLK